MHELKTGLYADKFATFWIFPERFLSLIRFANDPYTVYNGLNASRVARFRKKTVAIVNETVRTQIHFLSDISSVIASLDLKVPSLPPDETCVHTGRSKRFLKNTRAFT